MFNPRNVINLLHEDYKHMQSSTPSEEEIRLKNNIKEIIDGYMVEGFQIEEDTTLVCNRRGDPVNRGTGIELNTDTATEESVDEDENLSEPQQVEQTYKRCAVEYWKGCVRKKRRSLQSVKSKFKKVTSVSRLQRWEKSIQSGGTLAEKFAIIDKIVKERFDECTTQLVGVHDLDLQTWAIEASRGLDLHGFKASQHWVSDFKLRHSICSRKVTKFVTKAQVQDAPQIRKAADDFVVAVSRHLTQVGPENAYNSDQSGISLEMSSGRTLHPKGAKKIYSTVQRINSTTHSYTIQPVVNAKGQLMKPMMVILQETGGDFGKNVKKNLFQAPNLVVLATKSGKCTSSILKKWYKEIFYPLIKADSIVLLDAFGGFNAANEQDSSSEDENDIGEKHNVTVHRIPKLTTGLIQPLDVYGFRPYKNLLRRVSDRIRLHHNNFEMGVRNNIIKLQSLMFNVACSPRFNEMFRYGWYRSGYIDSHPRPFPTLVEYCFPQLLDICQSCEGAGFIRCSWCTASLCFGHFMDDYHLCENYVE